MACNLEEYEKEYASLKTLKDNLKKRLALLEKESTQSTSMFAARIQEIRLVICEINDELDKLKGESLCC